MPKKKDSPPVSSASFAMACWPFVTCQKLFPCHPAPRVETLWMIVPVREQASGCAEFRARGTKAATVQLAMKLIDAVRDYRDLAPIRVFGSALHQIDRTIGTGWHRPRASQGIRRALAACR